MLSPLFDIGSIQVMHDRSWIYRDSPQELRTIDYCNEVQSFINYALSNSRNISGGGIRCPCKRSKNKKSLNTDIVTMHLLHKGFINEYMCWYAHGEQFVPHETMIERMVGLTFSVSNVHGVVNDNINPYRTMVINAMRMNQGHAGQCPIIDKEPNAGTTSFFLIF